MVELQDYGYFVTIDVVTGSIKPARLLGILHVFTVIIVIGETVYDLSVREIRQVFFYRGRLIPALLSAFPFDSS